MTNAVSLNIPDPVPYVADFSGQRHPGIPQPFYCTFYNYDRGMGFFWHNWFFFHLPDTNTINVSQLGDRYFWGWQATDGQLP